MNLRKKIILMESMKKDFYGRPVSGPEENLEALQSIKLPKNILKPYQKELNGILFKAFDFHRVNNVDAFVSMKYMYIHPRVNTPHLIKQVIVHELCHVLYDAMPEMFNDGEIINEFSERRIELHRRLVKMGHNKHPVQFFMYVKYRADFDTMLHVEIPENEMRVAIKGLFPSIYSAVSFEEYWAVLFEEFFENSDFVKRISPRVYNKIFEILEECNE